MAPASPADVALEGASAAVNRHDWNSAEALLREVLSTQPEHPVGNYLLGALRLRQDRPREAQAAYSRALAAGLHTVQCFNEYGLASHAVGDFDRAEESYGYALDAAPDDPASLNNLGNLLRATGRAARACECYRRALLARPDAPDILTNLGVAARQSGDDRTARSSFERAICVDPAYHPAYNSLAIALRDAGALDEALDACARGLAVARAQPELLNTQAVMLHALGETLLADQSVCQAIDLRPDYWVAWDNRLMFSLYRDDLTGEDIDALHADWARRFEAAFPACSRPTPATGDSRGRPLRVGFLSADFRCHPVAQFIAPLFRGVDRSQVEVFAYSCHPDSDACTERLKLLVSHWRDVASDPEDRLQSRILEDRLDILVDLSGHTADNRLGVFARRAAPVQAGYLGYANRTGLATMDWRIVDAVTDPPAATSNRAEIPLRPDGCFVCYSPMPDFGNLPEPAGVPPSRDNGWVTFGSFNHLAKISPTIFRLWIEIVRKTPQSVLVIKSTGADCRRFQERLQGIWRDGGLAPGRLQFLGRDARYEEHLAKYRLIDIALDSFPYNGTTTTCDALWMGVPVVTLEGDRHAARVGASLLASGGHPELVARTGAAYVELAVALAADAERLGELHRKLRRDLEGSALMDQAAFGARILAVLTRIAAGR